MYDIVIENGTVIFGDLTLSKKVNIGILGEKIVKITKEKIQGVKIIDAKGKFVTPGFIDINRDRDEKFSPPLGVTTVINCKNLINLPNFTEFSLKDIRKNLESSFKNDILGVSFNLFKAPENFLKKNEIISILKILAKYNKIATFHIRDEGIKILESIEEIANYAKKSKVRVHISHLKISDCRFWGKAPEVINLLKKEKEQGINITFDNNLSLNTRSSLVTLLPYKYNLSKDFFKNLDYSNKKLNNEIFFNIKNKGGESRIIITHEDYFGLSLKDISKNLKKDIVTTTIYLLKKFNGEVPASFFAIEEEDMINFLKNDLGTISSGESLNYNPFHKFLQLSKERKMLTFEESIYKITGKPAKIFSIKERGIIKVGNYADLLILSLKEIESVIKNGEIKQII